jgi:8-oxo-dGTP pyrophosphatase MutT (NUDIX family)
MGERKQKEKLKREFSAGGVVFKKKGNKTLWLVAQTASSRLFPETYWRLPKGWLDDKGNEPGPLASGEKKATEEEIRRAAIKEVREEGGVEAKIVSKIGTVSYFYTWGGIRKLKFVTFFLMEWTNNLPEGFGWETSQTKWLPFEKAMQKLFSKSEKKVLEKAKIILEQGVQSSLV